jgi:methionyl-tRNA formyltransferase
MTGMGNAALKALISLDSVKVCGVIAPKEHTIPFPFYPCESLNQFCVNLGLSLFEGVRLKDDKTFELIKYMNPALIVVGSFSQIIPEKIIAIPEHGIINLHPSLLPKYRGPTPIRQVLLMGEKETGMSLLRIEDESIDSGRIILQSRIPIASSDDAGALREKLDCLGENILKKAIPKILSKERIDFLEQNEKLATYFPKLKPEDFIIDLDQSLDAIFNKIRALSPFPLARLQVDSEEHKIIGAVTLREKPQKMPLKQDSKIVLKIRESWVQFNIDP